MNGERPMESLGSEVVWGESAGNPWKVSRSDGNFQSDSFQTAGSFATLRSLGGSQRTASFINIPTNPGLFICPIERRSDAEQR